MPRAGSSNGDASGAPSSGGGNPKLDHLKNELKSAQNVMNDNINLVREREDNLAVLQNKTGENYSIFQDGRSRLLPQAFSLQFAIAQV